ncbi:NNT [Symbiodinium sp. CCMP2592]|nr:NNT [Symbiodinium sp. CCMP2592]
MPTPLGPWDPAGGASSWGWPWESAFAIDPRASYGSVYAAWSELKDLCTAKTSEVVDASSGFFFPPSLAPPPPPRRPRSAPYWDLSEAVPQERAEHNSSMRWTNRCGVKPVVADVLHKASTVPDAPREALDETSAAPMGEPTANLGIYGSIPGIPESFTLSEFLEKEPPFSPASTLCYSRQAPVSPASTVYCCDRQEPDSPASTVLAFEAPQPECDGGEDSPGYMPTHPTWRHFSQGRSRHEIRKARGEDSSSLWCGLFNSCCPDSAPESCSRCQHALGSSFDHRCPNCSKAVCAKCNCETFRYACEDEAASGAMNDCKSLMLGAWKTALEACDFIGTTLAGAAETPAMPQPWTKETFSATQPQTPSLPSMLGHRRRVSQATDVYKTYLPGEIPCSPEVR